MDDYEFRQRYLDYRDYGIPSPRWERPWGRPGGGAPCTNATRRHDLMQQNIFPHIKCDIREYPDSALLEKRRAAVRKSRYSGIIRNKDTDLLYQDSGRSTVDNLLRWKLPTDKQLSYNRCLDEMIEFKKHLKKEENKKITRLEKTALDHSVNWGAPGPGGIPWRKPVDIGKNFHYSMGWTTEATFPVMSAMSRCEHSGKKSTCVRLPSLAVPCRKCGPRGSTPNKQLMKMTGGVELVPLLRARGLPNSPSHHHHIHTVPRKLRCRPRDEEEWRQLSERYSKLREMA